MSSSEIHARQDYTVRPYLKTKTKQNSWKQMFTNEETGVGQPDAAFILLLRLDPQGVGAPNG